MINQETNMLSLFSGIAGLDRAAHLFGIKTVAFVEFDPFCQAILKLRYPGVPVYGDIRQVTGKQLERDGITRIDIVAGGFPCQGNSTAGNRKGKADERYLWPEMARIVRETNPEWMVAENVRGILSVDGGELFGDVLRDVVEMGHSVGWGCWGGNAVGAPHQRERVFILANSASAQRGARAEIKGNVREMLDNGSISPNASRSGQTCGIMWPTPRAGKIGGYSRPDFSPTLEQAILWPTPGANDCKGANHSIIQSIERHREKGVSKQIMLRDIPVFEKSQGQLNPDWVECLMNFPIGWTDPDCINPTPWPGWPAYRGQEQYAYEPPRIVTGMKNRPKRLKSLGNAVLPLQAVPIFKAITQIINYHKGEMSQ